MDLTFSKEERMFREKAREWLHANKPKEKRPSAGPEGAVFDKAWQRKQFEGGWAGPAWPRDAGGLGLSLIHQLIWQEEYARADAPNIGVMFVAINHGGPTLIARGSEAQKKFYLPKILQGETPWCQGFSEPGSGSDLASLKTRATVEGDHLVVNGQKIWTSYALHADYQELLVRTDPTAQKHRGLTWLICDMHLPGIEVRPIRTMAGDLHFAQVFYDNVRIPLQNIVGDVNDGWSVAMSTLSFERGTGMVGHQMLLANELERLIEVARVLPGPDGDRPAIKDDEIMVRLMTARAEVAALRAMTYAQISRGLREFQPGAEGNIIALYFGELIKKVMAIAFDLFGADVLEFEGPVREWAWHYLEAYKWTIAGGTSEIRRNVIGERVLGLPRIKGG